jgi:hypothetical protein
MWIVGKMADPVRSRLQSWGEGLWTGRFDASEEARPTGTRPNAADANGQRRKELDVSAGLRQLGQFARGGASAWWASDPADGCVEPVMGRVADGVANWVDRLRALGNGQVSAVAACAWLELLRRFDE